MHGNELPPKLVLIAETIRGQLPQAAATIQAAAAWIMERLAPTETEPSADAGLGDSGGER
jgi:hypothetical protein